VSGANVCNDVISDDHVAKNNRLAFKIIIFVATAIWTIGISLAIAGILDRKRIDSARADVKGISAAHNEILGAYWDCTSGLIPLYRAVCIGSVAKWAEVYGYPPAVIRLVFIDAGVIPAGQPEAQPATRPAGASKESVHH